MVDQIYKFRIYKHTHYRLIIQLNTYTDNYFAVHKIPKSIVYYTYKMSIKSNLPEEYVNFVDLTKEQNKNFEI